MKLSKPIRQADGSFRLRLRLGDRTLYAYGATEKECQRNAEAIKAQHRVSRPDLGQDTRQTLSDAIEAYCADRSNSLSPATIAKYENIRRNQYPDIMNKRLDAINARQWQQSVNKMLDSYATKTVSTSLGMLRTVVRSFGGAVPALSVGSAAADKARNMDKPKFLEPEQIPLFVAGAKDSPYCVPLLLALHSLRIAEIDGLDWSHLSPETIQIRQKRIADKDGNWITIPGAKTEGSVRDVPVMIPELEQAIRAAEKEGRAGKVLQVPQEMLRRECAAVCTAAGVPTITVHQLRHTFASLCAHLKIPMQICQNLGGWRTDAVMRAVYVHVAKSDYDSSVQTIRQFFDANLVPKPLRKRLRKPPKILRKCVK